MIDFRYFCFFYQLLLIYTEDRHEALTAQSAVNATSQVYMLSESAHEHPATRALRQHERHTKGCEGAGCLLSDTITRAALFTVLVHMRSRSDNN